jgi:hypothetical protein
MLKWTPIENIKNIKPENCIYRGELQIYTQDPISGDISHGESKRSANIFGIKKETSYIEFIASLNTNDKYESLKINKSNNITGCIKKTGRYAETKYKIGFTCVLLELNTCEVNNLESVNGAPKEIKKFKGIGYIDFVPWSYLDPIEINYYLYKNQLAYVTFTLSPKQYNDWLMFKEKDMQVFDNANTQQFY